MTDSQAHPAVTPNQIVSSAITRLLSHHFGDRSVYLIDDEDRELFHHAIAMGLVSEEGYLTHRGYEAWRHAEA